MATLAELARRYGILHEERIAHLQDLTGSWGLLADLSFSDLLLCAPTTVGLGAPMVLLGHVRPTTGPTLYRADLVGQVYESARLSTVWGEAEEPLVE